MDKPWNAGDHITLRYVGHSDMHVQGKPGVLQGWPYVVVEDRPDLLALWMPVGTRMKRMDMADRRKSLKDLVHGEHPTDPFRRGDVLRLMQPGKPYSIWLHWEPKPPHAFLGWYVNLEAPFVRTPIGVDTTDDSLDVVVLPDFSWHWKDEHLADVWIALGVYTHKETQRFYESGRAALADAEARRFPFDGVLLNWRPEPHWLQPEVHPLWDRVPGYDLPLSTGRRLSGVDHPLPTSR